MELIYLWVKEYKNIHKQGFNFSGRYRCEYDEEKNELTINENKDYVHIFPKNINVTAIVGKNGSGKSKILECLSEIFRIEHNKNRNLVADYDHAFDFHLVFKIGNKRYEIKSIDSRDGNTFVENEKIESLLDYFIYFHNQLNITRQLAFDNASIAKMIVHDYSNNKNFKLSSFMYLPNQIEIRLCDFEKRFEKLISDDKYYPMNIHESDFNYINNRDGEINSQIEYFNSLNDKFQQFLILRLLQKNQSTPSHYQTKEKIIAELNEDDLINEDDFEQYFVSLNKSMLKEKKQIDELTSEERSIYIERYSAFFEFDFIDSKSRRYNDLSHGEQTLFGQLLNIYYYSQVSQNDNFVFLFDEPEIALHPNWQKNYLNEVISLCEQAGERKFHFIVTSHSPFILSDISKENVLFLEKDEKTGHCKNVTKETNINTFGANIHTLLSDAFFMEDGLMGEYAKSKINKAIELLNKQGKLSKSSMKYCEEIISIIGEPILKKQLQRMLDSKRLSKIDEIDLLKAQMSEIQQKIKKLEGGK